MSIPSSSKIPLKPYIGTRDFYPEEFSFRKWMFDEQRKICNLYGYQEYSAPLLESLDLYRSKSSEEIVNEQVYSFRDRGEREIAIRPEMTPTVVRMVAQRQRELSYPLRWFSIANFMRYERPGHGRLREFYQLNVDLFGVQGVAGQVELLSLAIDLLRNYGADSRHFKVYFSDRRLLASHLQIQDGEHLHKLSRIIDKKSKLSQIEFDKELKNLNLDKSMYDKLQDFFKLKLSDLPSLDLKEISDKEKDKEKGVLNSLTALMRGLEAKDKSYLDYIEFDPTLMRGFDYYTDFIFEIYDLNPENNRSLFGGGAYNNLMDKFGGQALNALGFGMGDLTLQNFLESNHFIPSKYSYIQCDVPPTPYLEGIFMTLMSEELLEASSILCHELRKQGVEVEQMLEVKKLSRQLEIAQKKKKRIVLILGSSEIQEQEITVKHMDSGNQEKIKQNELVKYLKSHSL